MSYDRREAILTHIQTVTLANIPGIKGVFRNRNELPPSDKTPGIILLDGVEKLKTEFEGRNFRGQPPAVFTLRPGIILALTVRTDPDNTLLPDGTVSPVGQELSSFRMLIANAMTNDFDLVTMLGDNGSVFYEGHETDMQNGSTIGSLGAVMQLTFAISYVLDPNELT
jgi:hypothetical protein